MIDFFLNSFCLKTSTPQTPKPNRACALAHALAGIGTTRKNRRQTNSAGAVKKNVEKPNPIEFVNFLKLEKLSFLNFRKKTSIPRA